MSTAENDIMNMGHEAKGWLDEHPDIEKWGGFIVGGLLTWKIGQAAMESMGVKGGGLMGLMLMAGLAFAAFKGGGFASEELLNSRGNAGDAYRFSNTPPPGSPRTLSSPYAQSDRGGPRIADRYNGAAAPDQPDYRQSAPDAGPVRQPVAALPPPAPAAPVFNPGGFTPG